MLMSVKQISILFYVQALCSKAYKNINLKVHVKTIGIVFVRQKAYHLYLFKSLVQ